MIGQTISHYKILEKLGEGGMGVVYKAQDLKLDRFVALKFLPQHLTIDETQRTRFLQEAKAASSLNHPNVCVIHDLQEHDGQQYIIMEYVEGKTLRERLHQSSISDLQSVLSYAIQIAEALHEAHSKGIIHRDIKSENIMVNSKDQIKVMDFGLAKLKGARKITRSTSTVGTLAYMAPELVQGGEADARSDIFSFGVVLYEMLTGHLPFRGEHEAAIVYSILNEEPESINELPGPIMPIVEKALAKDPAERYQSVEEMLIDLKAMQKGVEIRTSTKRFRRRKVRRVSLYAGIAALIGIAALYIFLTQTPVSAERKSIAVLPFKNMSDSKEEEYFSDGITEDIITHLSNIGELKVISRTSVMQYKSTNKNLRDIGKELDVATVLEGSVRRAGNQVRIVAQLIDAGSDEHLWAHTYDKELTQIFAIQTDVAQQIAAALKARLSPVVKERIEKKPTENLDAYAFYLKGREYYYRYRKEDNENAISLFKKALELDRNYSLAYAGLGKSYYQRLNMFGFPDVWVDSSLAMSTKALSLDPNLAEAHDALGNAYDGKGWFTKAMEEEHRAIELNPNYFTAVVNYGYFCMVKGELAEGLKWQRKALRLNPSFAMGYNYLGDTYMLLTDYSQALDSYEKAEELKLAAYSNYGGMFAVHLRDRQFSEAVKDAEKRLATDNDTLGYLDQVGFAFLCSGDEVKAREYFSKYALRTGINSWLDFLNWKVGQRDPAQKHIDRRITRLDSSLRADMQAGSEDRNGMEAYQIFRWLTVENKKTEAFQWMQKAIASGWVDYRYALIDPMVSNLHDDPEFKQMIAEVKQKVDRMKQQVQEMEERELSQ